MTLIILYSALLVLGLTLLGVTVVRVLAGGIAQADDLRAAAFHAYRALCHAGRCDLR